ncbi:hypothetical protein TSTA_057630 [Talaromyces stipitatus ATCC 10500]|uniref:Uncharacterized protein n=1 Tax=Talaromyces stipitatus (strain ATCC 10500 / CBS 375.48 / QM 6759 / NRRL 1006) TaxID=441959 RepID=B8MRT9_TALSN|nr:uncharacterized protein TSTA_057630 [Talaromyces stipitatus ATCC 10500]EED13273.1 hypothetical protein TSTA_057630 [Talaromyces stipitatus ATCC 10500]
MSTSTNMRVFRLRSAWRLSQTSRLSAPRYQNQFRSVATKQASPAYPQTSSTLNQAIPNPSPSTSLAVKKLVTPIHRTEDLWHPRSRHKGGRRVKLIRGRNRLWRIR